MMSKKTRRSEWIGRMWIAASVVLFCLLLSVWWWRVNECRATTDHSLFYCITD